MKLKIEGEITPERVAEAVADASRMWSSTRPGGKFYGAKIQLVPFDAEGSKWALVDDQNEPFVMIIPALPGTIVRPALTAEGKQNQKDRRVVEQQQEVNEPPLQPTVAP
jgi:hypothetical protein